MNTFETEGALLGAIILNNFTSCPLVFGPNERVAITEYDDGSGPPTSWASWDIYEYDMPDLSDMEGGEFISARVSVGLFQKIGTGDKVIRGYADELSRMVRAVRDGAVSMNVDGQEFSGFAFLAHGLYGNPLEPEGIDTTGKNWYGRQWSAWFIRSDNVSAEEAATLAGIGYSTKMEEVVAHGFSVGEWLTRPAGTYIRAQATEAQHPIEVVLISEVQDEDHFSVVSSGFVQLPGHGFSVGPLYLSQATPGAGTSTPPDSGWSQLIAVVYDAENLIVIQRAGVVL